MVSDQNRNVHGGRLVEERPRLVRDQSPPAFASGSEALIVDPLLPRLEEYLARLSALGLQLAYSADTHTHADHLSATKELCRRTGARSAGAPRTVVQLPLSDGDQLAL